MAEDFGTIAVIGTGLIGGSLALAAKAAGAAAIIGCARTQSTLDTAKTNGIIDSGFIDCRQAAENADIVFIATPVSSVVETARTVIPAMKKGAILTDAASVKGAIVAMIDETASAAGIRYVGGHPMAGSEVSGVDNANADLFRNAAYILTPTDRTDADGLKILHSLIGAIGARVFTMSPAAHDAAVAVISHLPHLAAAALVNVAESERGQISNLFKLAAGGFYDMTRIAGSPSDLWVDIAGANKEAIEKAVADYQVELETMLELVRDADNEGLSSKLERARAVRNNLPRLREDENPLVIELTIVIPNRPKVLSDVTMRVAEIGVNIEDIQIVHSTEADDGLLRLSVLGEDDAKAVEEALTKAGYSVGFEKRLK
jgi:prephenate dehydrogenase